MMQFLDRTWLRAVLLQPSYNRIPESSASASTTACAFCPGAPDPSLGLKLFAGQVQVVSGPGGALTPPGQANAQEPCVSVTQYSVSWQAFGTIAPGQPAGDCQQAGRFVFGGHEFDPEEAV